MRFDDLQHRSVLPLAHVVCGAELLPMTVGHARVLDALGLWNAVLPQELILAAFICSRSHRDVTAAIQHKGTVLRLKWWAWRLGRKWDYVASAGHWASYVTYHREEPLVSMNRSGGQMGMPWLTHLRAMACKGLGYDPMTVDDAPLAQVVMDYYAFAESEGAVNVTPFSTSEIKQRRQANG